MSNPDLYDWVTEEELENHIAVIGMSCKFPDADDPRIFWENILAKKESISFFSKTELIQAGINLTDIENIHYVPARGIITDVDKFDAPFFGYSSFDASITDPQHRIFLEQAWAAIENAGYAVDQYTGLIGLFAGMADSTYLKHNLEKNPHYLLKSLEVQTLLASSPHFLSTKVAYAMGLTGPCVNVNTACSTSLVAIIMACQSLTNYDCDMALAGGITIIVPQQSGYLYEEAGIYSPDGHCRAFDKNAQGTVISNGCGIVVLKRLLDAIEANDNIIAVIKGWNINNDGNEKVSFTAPSINGQAACAASALAHANIEPVAVSYIETHGTGTLLGDPIEIAALTKGYQYHSYQKSQYCAISSVKPNIGHTDIAAGVAGFIKTAMALKAKILPPTLHYQAPNEKINFTKTPFYVTQSAQTWKTRDQQPRIAAVNSLGFGGTNAHLIMQEAPVILSGPTKSANVVILSAKTATSLAAMTKKIYEHVVQISQDIAVDQTIADTAYTLQLGRNSFQYRQAIVYSNKNDLLQALKNNIAATNKAFIKTGETKNARIIFGFPGQGTQYANMAIDIYAQQPLFKEIVDDCCERLNEIINFDLRELLFPTEHNVNNANEKLRQTQYAQPALFVIEYALAKLLMALEIKPHAMIGHSIGEYTAATLSGVLTVEDALILVAARASLMARTPPGAMLAVPMSKKELMPILTENLALAAHNAPELCVISGAKDQIADFNKFLLTFLSKKDLTTQALHVSHAFHSAFMDEILAEFLETIKKISFADPQIPYISNVTGNWITNVEIQSQRYWADQIRNTVCFSEGVSHLHLTDDDVFIEIGPGQTLGNLIRQHKKSKQKLFVLNTLPYAKEQQMEKINSYRYLLGSIAKLWLNGWKINWKNLYKHEIRKRIPLPTYCFDDYRYWVNPIANDNQIVEKTKFANDRFFSITWERDLELSAIKNAAKNALETSHSSKQAASKTWLIFTDKSEFCNTLVRSLKSKNTIVYEILMDNDFNNLADYIFTISPTDKSHYLQLLAAIKLTNSNLSVIHCWSLTDHFETSQTVLQQGAYSLLYLSQAYIEIYPEKNLKLTVLVNHVHKVLGSETIYPPKATVIGPCKVIPKEQENINCKFIDIDLKNIALPKLIDAIYWEANDIQPQTYQMDIAYRADYRWLRNFKPCSNYIDTNQVERLKVGGVYLITGGMGGIGLALAQDLAINYHANLILVSRSKLMSENEWATWLNDSIDKDSTLFKKISVLNKIKQRAATLIIKQADVAVESQMREVIECILQKFGRLDGVIHAAGVPGDGIAQFKTVEEYNRILQPKLYGTQILINLLKDQQLDFFVFMSSITAITGFPGQIDYCSANLAMDAYAISNCFSPSVFCITMNWESWREVGMAAESKTKLVNLDESNSLSPEQGVLLFKKMLNSSFNQVIISGSQLNELKTTKNNLTIITSIDKDQDNSKQAYTNSINRVDEVIKTLSKLWCDVLDMESVDLEADFYQLGGNSLSAISLITRIRKQFGIKIPPAVLFKAKTVKALAEFIKTNIQEQKGSALVTLQAGGDKPPLFMLHPVGGNVFCYLATVKHLKNDRIIYGLQDPSIEKETQMFATLNDMARAYCDTILTVQQQGPYFLCGSSFGAILAFEIAHQLLRRKKLVALVGLIDGWAKFSSMQYDKNYYQMVMQRHGQDKNLRLLPNEIDNPKLWEDLLQHRLKMLLDYKMVKIDTKLTLFKSEEILPEYKEIDKIDNHWSAFSTLPIEIFNVPGDHNSMLQEKNAKILAEYIQACLEQ